MKIQRSINGMKFNIQLLPDELVEAYFEQQNKFDIEDVVDYAEAFGREELKEYVGCDYKTYLDNKELIAEKMRKHIDSGMSMPDARELAIDEVINKELIAAI